MRYLFGLTFDLWRGFWFYLGELVGRGQYEWGDDERD